MKESVKSNNSGNTAPKPILVAIDFSDSSRRVLAQALSLAGDPSRLILLHVVAPVPNPGVDLTKQIVNARQKLKQFCIGNGIAAPELIQLEVRSGPAFMEILECAEEHAAEMIIVGADRTSALDGTALGHTADRVSRYAHCPVLLVRETETNLPSAKRTFTSRPRAG